MFSHIKGVFIVLLSFSGSLATKCLFLIDQPCMVRLILNDLNPVEIKYYPFVISLDKCTGRCNVLTPKICVQKDRKNINVKGLNIITNKNGAKTMKKHICKFSSKTSNSNPNEILKHINMNVKIIVRAKKIITGILAHVFVRIAKFKNYLKYFSD